MDFVYDGKLLFSPKAETTHFLPSATGLLYVCSLRKTEFIFEYQVNLYFWENNSEITEA